MSFSTTRAFIEDPAKLRDNTIGNPRFPTPFGTSRYHSQFGYNEKRSTISGRQSGKLRYPSQAAKSDGIQPAIRDFYTQSGLTPEYLDAEHLANLSHEYYQPQLPFDRNAIPMAPPLGNQRFAPPLVARNPFAPQLIFPPNAGIVRPPPQHPAFVNYDLLEEIDAPDYGDHPELYDDEEYDMRPRLIHNYEVGPYPMAEYEDLEPYPGPPLDLDQRELQELRNGVPIHYPEQLDNNYIMNNGRVLANNNPYQRPLVQHNPSGLNANDHRSVNFMRDEVEQKYPPGQSHPHDYRPEYGDPELDARLNRMRQQLQQEGRDILQNGVRAEGRHRKRKTKRR